MKLEIAIEQVWPETGKELSLVDALQLAGEYKLGERIKAAARSYRMANKMGKTPIVAVTGELNSGKSSVISTFLSLKGQNCVPRGVGAECGTHRFVYWLPKSWSEDKVIKESLISLITDAHGNSREYLEVKPDESAKQYASGRDHLEKMRVPLIAWDSKLDELGIGLLDCPDIQTKDEPCEEVGLDDVQKNHRLEFLADAARVCSAFCLVWSHESLRNRVLGEMVAAIREKMKDAPLYLLINKIDPSMGHPEDILQGSDLNALLQSNSISQSHVFGAYNFRILGQNGKKGWLDYTPDYLIERSKTCTNELPQFYALYEGADSNTDLFELSKELDIAELQKTKISDHLQELRLSLKEGVEELKKWEATSRKQYEEIHEGLLSFCENSMKDPSGKALQNVTPEFITAFDESFKRKAPWLARKSLNLVDPFQKQVGKAAKIIKKVGYLKDFSNPKVKIGDDNEGSKIVKNFNEWGGEWVNSQRLAEKMHALRWCPAEVTDDALMLAWDKIICHYKSHPITSFDNEVLDEVTESMWKGFSGWKKFWIVSKAWLGILGSLAAVLGLVTVLIDGGLTLVSASLANMIAGSYFAIGGVAGGVASLTSLKLLQNMMREQNTLPYLSRLFATAADAFGLPRKMSDTPLCVKFVEEDNSSEISYALPDPVNFSTLRPVVLSLIDSDMWKVRADIDRVVKDESIESWIKY